jgi:hypothetical protein
VEEFIQYVFEVPITTAAIQKVIDRVFEALAPVHQSIGASVRRAALNHVQAIFQLLVDTLKIYFKEQTPYLSWLT